MRRIIFLPDTGKMNVEAYKLTSTSTFVKISGGHAAVSHVPLHIIAVIDVSGSMEEASRLVNVKRSLNHMVPMMTEEDVFSLISFSDTAEVHCENVALNAGGITIVQNTIESLHTIGSTNLSAALISARDIVSRTPTNKKVCILILTDGHVNMGISSNDHLMALVNGIRDVSRPASSGSPSSTSIFAVGYGADHNYSLLQSFASVGGGSYQVVNTLEHVASVFGDMLGGMQTISAQNAEIIMPATANAITGLRVTTSTGGVEQKKIQLGDVYAGGQNSLIITDIPVAVNNEPRSIHYQYFDVAVVGMVSGSCVISLESSPEIIREGEMYMLKQNMADLMNRIATGVIPNADLRNEIQAAIDQLRPYVSEPWVAAMITNFERQIRLISQIGVAAASRGISGIAANNAAVLATSRGVAMMSQDIDDMNAHTSADLFSTPAQRNVSGGLVRGVTSHPGPHPTVGGGSRSHISRSGLSGGIASLDPFGSVHMPLLPPDREIPEVYTYIPPMPAPMVPIGQGITVIIPPPPTIEELEAEVPADAGYMTPRNQIRTIDISNPPPAPIRNNETGEPSPKRTRTRL